MSFTSYLAKLRAILPFTALVLGLLSFSGLGSTIVSHSPDRIRIELREVRQPQIRRTVDYEHLYTAPSDQPTRGSFRLRSHRFHQLIATLLRENQLLLFACDHRKKMRTHSTRSYQSASNPYASNS